MLLTTPHILLTLTPPNTPHHSSFTPHSYSSIYSSLILIGVVLKHDIRDINYVAFFVFLIGRPGPVYGAAEGGKR